MSNVFFEIGDGYRASEIYSVGSQWRINTDFPGTPQVGDIATVLFVEDGTSDSLHDDTCIKTNTGCFTASEAEQFLESLC